MSQVETCTTHLQHVEYPGVLVHVILQVEGRHPGMELSAVWQSPSPEVSILHKPDVFHRGGGGQEISQEISTLALSTKSMWGKGMPH